MYELIYEINVDHLKYIDSIADEVYDKSTSNNIEILPPIVSGNNIVFRFYTMDGLSETLYLTNSIATYHDIIIRTPQKTKPLDQPILGFMSVPNTFEKEDRALFLYLFTESNDDILDIVSIAMQDNHMSFMFHTTAGRDLFKIHYSDLIRDNYSEPAANVT